MKNMWWDGHDLMAALSHAAAVLQLNVEEVNALNVFPVPDGDTGSNMLATIQAALAEAQGVPEAERSATRVSAAISLGALMGARGNSGVILSQLLRGIGEAIAGNDRVTAPILVQAFRRGCATAFAAVAQPVEGTMLTVARDVADAADSAPPGDGSVEHVLRVAVDAAAASVRRTPDLLPVLKKAGVVDAGGRGVELLLRGALASIRGEPLPEQISYDIPLPTPDGLEAEGFGYETVFLILPADGTRLDAAAIRARLDRMGESVLVAGDERAVKIHVHNERPDQILRYGLTLGSLSRINVENLDRQATDVWQRAKAASERNRESVAVVPREGTVVIAVAPGAGLARVFSSLGAGGVVQGGQSANPSAGEIADAIRAAGGNRAIVLPNNSNVRMAARLAGELIPGVNVEVVPTRNAAEGVAALLAFDPEMGLKDAAKAMTAAGRAIQSLQVTVAVRDARIGRHKVRSGEYIVLGPSDGLVAVNRDRTAAIRAGVGSLKKGYELLTIYRGGDVDHAAAQQLRDELATELDGVEIELVEGGQPHYDFLIAAE